MSTKKTSRFKPMSMKDISLFKPISSENKGLIDESIVKWTSYVDRHKDKIPDTKSASVELFKYNISNQEQLLQQDSVDMWLMVASYIHTQSSYPFIGSALRSIYETSTKSKTITESINEHLMDCTLNEVIDFICMDKRNHAVLNSFYTDPSLAKRNNCKTLMVVHVETLKSNGLLGSNSIYIAQHIYTSSFIEKLTSNSNMATLAYQESSVKLIVKDLKLFMERLVSSPDKQLEHLVSLYYSATVIAEQGLSDFTGQDGVLTQYFQKQFPEEYKEYQTLRSLGIPLKPSEFLTQLNSQCPTTFELPELHYEH